MAAFRPKVRSAEGRNHQVTIFRRGLPALLLVWGAGAAAQTPEERAVARDLLAKHSDAVVQVMATARIRLDMAGHEQSNDQTVEVNGVILDPNGLTVTSLSALHPEETMMRMGARMGANAPQISAELSDLRIRLADGREVPAQLVLRDADLDLAFVKPTEAQKGWPAVTGNTAKPLVMDLVIGLRRMNEVNAWSPAASFSYVQLVIEKPRRYLSLSGGTGIGSAIFDAKGQWVGVAVMRSQGGRLPSTISVITGDDIREVAKQVP
jgi:hypothetical protein